MVEYAGDHGIEKRYKLAPNPLARLQHFLVSDGCACDAGRQVGNARYRQNFDPEVPGRNHFRSQRHPDNIGPYGAQKPDLRRRVIVWTRERGVNAGQEG
jgi:hypothetical protein